MIDFKEKIKIAVGSFLSNIIPLRRGNLKSKKIINIITLVLAVFFLFQLYKEHYMISYIFFNNEAEWDLSVMLYLLPIFLVPIATILFFKRKKIGWMLLTAFLCYSFVILVVPFMLVLNSNYSLLNKSPENFFIFQVIPLSFFTIILGIICRKGIREVYSISVKFMLITISFFTGLTALILQLIFL